MPRPSIQRFGVYTAQNERSCQDPPEALYDWYTQRGATEGWIKDFKSATA